MNTPDPSDDSPASLAKAGSENKTFEAIEAECDAKKVLSYRCRRCGALFADGREFYDNSIPEALHDGGLAGRAGVHAHELHECPAPFTGAGLADLCGYQLVPRNETPMSAKAGTE